MLILPWEANVGELEGEVFPLVDVENIVQV